MSGPDLPRIIADHRMPLANDDFIVVRRCSLGGFLVEIIRQGTRDLIGFSNIQDLTAWLHGELGGEQRQRGGWLRRGQ